MCRIRISDPIIRSHVARAIVFERLGRDARALMYGPEPQHEVLYRVAVGAVIRLGEQLQEAAASGQATRRG